MNAHTLELLCRDLDEAKARELEAVAVRRAVEADIIACLDNLPSEGSASVEAGHYKLTVTQAIRRKVDADLLAEIAPSIPEAIGARLIRWKPDLVLRELRYLEANEPAIYATVARAIEAKPGKPSIKLENVAVEKAA